MHTDDQALTTTERIRTSIQQGESHFREFKTAFEGPPQDKRPRDPAAVRRDIAEALVAFANADGGELFIGVEDHGGITGIPHTERSVEKFLQAPTTNVLDSTPLQGVVRARVRTEGKLVLFFAVEKSTSYIHQTSDGRCLQRRDRETRPISSDELLIERAEQRSREYDRQYVDGATVADLDVSLLAQLVQALGGGLSPEKALQLVELAEYAAGRVRLRRAALLLFAKEIQRWHPRSQVRIFRVHGTEARAGSEYNVEELETATGAVVALVAEAWDALRPHLSRTVYTRGLFESRITYPDDACFEALVNAIAHRDYSNEGRAIEIAILDDRLEIRSPGGLLSNVTLQGLTELRGVHQSRNAFIARGLRELGVMREMGEGMRRIFELFRQNDLVDPMLSPASESFSIEFFHRSVFSQAAQRWLAAFERFNLTGDERKVVLLGRDGAVFSAQDVMNTLRISDTEEYRVVVEGLQLKGLLESTMTQTQVTNAAKQQRGRGRDIGSARRRVPRYRIRDPLKAEVYLSELTRAVRSRSTHDAGLTGPQQEAIRKSLSPDSPYRTTQMVRVLQALDLIDEARRMRR